MSVYNMPPDTSAREKIIGGKLDWVQLIWVLIGLVIGFLVGAFFKLFFGMIGMVIGFIPGIAFAIIFCFVKIHELSVFDYLRYRKKHRQKTKKLPNVRTEALEEEDIKNIKNY